MIRTTTLAATALLGTALLAPTTSYAAAAETCQGLPATIVGSPATFVLTGTEGPDVIVTNGTSMKVDALGGDDVICVTGRGPGQVFAGAGNDVVDTTGLVQFSGSTFLGAGSDRFIGGPERDTVYTGEYDPLTATHTDTERDVVDLGPSRAAVDDGDGATSGQPGVTNADEIRLGTGGVSWAGIPTAGTVLDGGADSAVAFTVEAGEDVAIDNRAGTMSVAGRPTLQFSGFTGFDVVANGVPSAFSFRGTGQDETLSLQYPRSFPHRVRMGGGDDEVSIVARGVRAAAQASYSGGRGRDLLRLHLPEEVDLDLDLPRGHLSLGPRRNTVTVRAASFDDATLVAEDVEVEGTGMRNDVNVSACRARVDGRGGNDRITAFADQREPRVRCSNGVRATFLGGPGKDRLTGSRGPDRLVGGPGRDTADGARGRDTCSAEKVRSCEKRL